MRPSITPRARVHVDRAGDPLDGLVNLFELGIVLAVGFLLAVLSSLQLSDLLTTRNLTIIRNPGSPQQEIVIKEGQRVRTLRPSQEQAIGRGRRVGSVYRLDDGRTVYVTGGE